MAGITVPWHFLSRESIHSRVHDVSSCADSRRGCSVAGPGWPRCRPGPGHSPASPNRLCRRGPVRAAKLQRFPDRARTDLRPRPEREGQGGLPALLLQRPNPRSVCVLQFHRGHMGKAERGGSVDLRLFSVWFLHLRRFLGRHCEGTQPNRLDDSPGVRESRGFSQSEQWSYLRRRDRHPVHLTPARPARNVRVRAGRSTLPAQHACAGSRPRPGPGVTIRQGWEWGGVHRRCRGTKVARACSGSPGRPAPASRIAAGGEGRAQDS